MRSPLVAELAAMAAVGYALAGGAGAAALATTGPALMHEYAAAASTHQTLIAAQFTILVVVVWRGIWQFPGWHLRCWLVAGNRAPT